MGRLSNLFAILRSPSADSNASASPTEQQKHNNCTNRRVFGRGVGNMKCVLIFDHLNDLIYSKCDKRFAHHVKKLARIQGLIPETETKDDEEKFLGLSSNVIMQLFSPIVTSQRIMSCQFGNSYSSVQCQDGTSMVFDEYLGYLFAMISTEDVEIMKRNLSTCIVLVQHVCGPDVAMLKRIPLRAELLTRMIDVWVLLRDSEQSFLVEAVEQLSVNPEITMATMKALQEACDRLKGATDFNRIHAAVFVENKFLSLYSSRGAQDLTPADILFLTLLTEVYQPVLSKSKTAEAKPLPPEEEEDEFFSPMDSPNNSRRNSGKDTSRPLLLRSPKSKVSLNTPLSGSNLALLLGSPPGFNPHVVHVAPISEKVALVLVLETGSTNISVGLWEACHALNSLQSLQLQKDLSGVKATTEILDGGVKKILEGLKKIRSLGPDYERCHRQLTANWDFLRKKYVELIKSQDLECVLRVESCGIKFMELLCEIFRLVCLDQAAVTHSADPAKSVAKAVRARLADFIGFLKVKAMRNFTLGSRATLSINKYLEEFPGLVHFLYIDRTNHRVTTPSLDFSSEETMSLTKRKIWAMVDFSRAHLVDGHISLMWKDTTFNYAYFLWFEDSSGAPMRPKVFPTAHLKNMPQPGIFCGDFYQSLIGACFPKIAPGKVQCFELFCVHLGLATSSCVLEHTRRLAATIWEVTGVHGNPADLL
ncbi:BLOC-3 complex member HPS1 [Neocloeon triangulifer]|uniref:BLOC-3 complex member HPS1 n=1 Tax=Neocloeon triangulifer TaxID=2078957 RepID=UPI00286F8116|nr:BLOC-3 complex member HPS1 [Neocloeon triangulifer]